MRRHLVLVFTVGLTWLVFAPPARGGASDLPPTATAWWQVGPIALVTSAGMEDHELLVEGFGSDDATQQAVAALAFAAPEDDAPVELRIPVASATPPDATFQVCTVTEPFEPVAGGPAEDVPAHDCSTPLTAKPSADGQVVVVPLDAETGGDVRVLLIPDGPGRIVLDGDGSRLRTGPSTTAPSGRDSAGTPSPPPDGAPPVPDARSTLGPPRTAPALPAEPVARPSVEPTPPPTAGTEAGSPLAAPVVGYRPPASDASARAVTAALVAGALGAFTALNRGGTSRLRPATVPWLSSHE